MDFSSLRLKVPFPHSAAIQQIPQHKGRDPLLNLASWPRIILDGRFRGGQAEAFYTAGRSSYCVIAEPTQSALHIADKFPTF